MFNSSGFSCYAVVGFVVIVIETRTFTEIATKLIFVSFLPDFSKSNFQFVCKYVIYETTI